MASKTTKALLLSGIAAIAISTPIFAYNGLGPAPAHNKHRKTMVCNMRARTYVSPQAQQYYAGHDVSGAYQVPAPQAIYTGSYIQTNAQIPVR